jgi:hypothetical protein
MLEQVGTRDHADPRHEWAEPVRLDVSDHLRESVEPAISDFELLLLPFERPPEVGGERRDREREQRLPRLFAGERLGIPARPKHLQRFHRALE